MCSVFADVRHFGQTPYVAQLLFDSAWNFASQLAENVSSPFASVGEKSLSRQTFF